MSGWLSKQAAHLGWRKRWYELSSTKLSWYSTPSKKAEVGNLPLFLIEAVQEGAKATQFIVKTREGDRDQLVFQAPTAASRDEWVKVLTMALEQRKARTVEDQMLAPRIASISSADPAVASPASPSLDEGRASTPVTAPDAEVTRAVEADVEQDEEVLEEPTEQMSKEAQEKFVHQMRQCILEQDVDAVRAMLDPKPPRDTFVWFSKEELGRTLLHLAVDSGNLKVTDLVASADARQLELPDQLGWTPLHVAAHKGSVEMGELLLRLGAPADPKDNVGRAPFYTALASGRHEFARVRGGRGGAFLRFSFFFPPPLFR